MAPKAPVVVDMAWSRDLEFSAQVANTTIVLDSSGKAGGSPVDLLATSLAGCMAMDVAFILTKGRYTLRALRVHLVAERAPDVPHRIVAAQVRFAVDSDAPADAVSRAIALSHEKYCSVWHSMRQDIDLQVAFDLVS